MKVNKYFLVFCLMIGIGLGFLLGKVYNQSKQAEIQPELEEEQDPLAFDDNVVTGQTRKGAERIEKFFKNVTERRYDALIIVSPPIDSRPSVTDLVYDGYNVTVRYDNTRDNLLSEEDRQMREYTCDKDVKIETKESFTIYSATGCMLGEKEIGDVSLYGEYTGMVE